MTTWEDAIEAKDTANQNHRDARWCYNFAEGAELNGNPDTACYALRYAEAFIRRSRRALSDLVDAVRAGEDPPKGEEPIGPEATETLQRIIQRIEDDLDRLQDKIDTMKQRLNC